MKAVWNNAVIAESHKTVIVEGNHYFPPESVRMEYFIDSATSTYCGWKGTACYHSLIVDGEKNVDAAWFYPDTLPDAKHIENYVAFWKGVRVEE